NRTATHGVWHLPAGMPYAACFANRVFPGRPSKRDLGGYSMLFYSQGTVFNAGTDAVVNTVNCSGVMGTGLALEFRLRYPRMFEEYQRRARAGAIRPGFVDYYVDESGLIIVNFPTKNHFARPSKLEWIERGLKHFVSTYGSWSFQSIAFPKLGTDHGRLNWKDVKTL